MYWAVQSQSKLFFSRQSFVLISLDILMQLIELNSNFEYFIYTGGMLKRGLRVATAPLTNKHVLILNFFITNICFISHSFIWDTK